MTITSAILFISTVFFLFTQIGLRVSAKDAGLWWIILVFLLVASLFPETLEPLAHAFGFELVSNFVLSGLIFFLFIQLYVVSTRNYSHYQRFRDSVSTLAARDYRDYETFSMTPEARVLVVLGCYNEEESLPTTLEHLRDLRQSTPWIDVCLINDGSRDATELILQRNQGKLRHVMHTANIGVSGVLLTAFKIQKTFDYEYVVQCDSDGQHPIREIPELILRARQGTFDILIGSRFVEKHESSLESTTSIRRTGGKVISLFLRLFGREAGVTDPTSGLRVYSKKACEFLSYAMPEEYPEPESIALASLNGLKIGETPVKMAPRSGGVSSLSFNKSVIYMGKVVSALLATRLRWIFKRRRF